MSASALKVVPCAADHPVVGMTGPILHSNNEQEKVQSPLESCAGITVRYVLERNRLSLCCLLIPISSTYPKRGDKQGRDGDPVADRYGLFQYTNRAIFVVADGCNWGDRSARVIIDESFFPYYKLSCL